MNHGLLPSRTSSGIPLIAIIESEFTTWLEQQDAFLHRWLQTTGFKAKSGQFSLIPGAEGQLRAVVIVISKADGLWALGGLPAALPEGDYALDAAFDAPYIERLTLGWALGAYQFTRYKTPKRTMARLARHPVCNAERIQRQVEAITQVRDLINTPAEDLMPEHLAEMMQGLAQASGASLEQIIGEELLTRNFPLIHAVGRASAHP
ncbi:MAG: leucyl aminopeptidase family protein, partial [Candidatus Competibacteraceae bacterium]|nr:leucyl aminopeptidase family protein [Candidatus Competibacteraceae bacterium]